MRDLLTGWRLRRRLARAVAGAGPAPAIRRARRVEATGDGAVFAAEADGRKVILRLREGTRAAERTRDEANELAAKGARLGTGKSRVPEVVFEAAGAGLLAVAHAPGDRMDRILRASPARRAEMLGLAGRWLADYTRGERASDDFGGGFWLRARQDAVDAMPDSAAQEVARELIGLMGRSRARIGARPVTRARSHGHLAPRKLFVEGETVWGTGVTAAHWIAVVRDLAQFLVDLQVAWPAEGAPGPAGFSEDDVAAMTRAKIVHPAEIAALLPFFAASELVAAMAAAGGPVPGAAVDLGRRMLVAEASRPVD